MISNTASALAATLAAFSVSAACAHPTHERQEAAVGAPYKAIVRVPHGCEGSATVRVRVQIPEGVIGVKPMPKSGWTIEMTRGAYAAAGQSSHDPKFPAPELRLVQAQAPVHSHGTAHAPGPQTFKAGSLVIEAPWSRATPGGARVGAGYLKIINTGKEADRLIGGTIEVAKKFEIHEMAMVDNVMKMRMLPKGLEIRPGETVELKPGGHHLMFVDLARPLKADDVVKGVLRFERAGEVAVEYRVAPLGAQPKGGHKHH